MTSLPGPMARRAWSAKRPLRITSRALGWQLLLVKRIGSVPPRRDGATYRAMLPRELVQRLAALV